MGRRKRRSNICHSAGKVTAGLLLSFLAISPTAAGWTDKWRSHGARSADTLPPLSQHEQTFVLRHVFHRGTNEYPDLHKRLDVKPEAELWSKPEEGEEREPIKPLKLKSQSALIERLKSRRLEDIDPLLRHARYFGEPPSLPSSAWILDHMPAPNVTDKETVVNLALMAANAYDKDWTVPEWEDVKPPFNHSQSFGWDSDGLRGHIYVDKTNSTVVIGLKGTSPAVFDGADTTTTDKENDNLFFSCCCGQGGQYLWRQVCECMSSAYKCNSTCLVKALKSENRYYKASLELYGNVTELYPDADVWMVGHSLGGAVSALVGLTHGIPVTTFEAPSEALAAARLGLFVPHGIEPGQHQNRKNTGAVHFGHTADPIFMGSCNGATSGCTLGGYAMQTQCHTGKVCRYDTVNDHHWRSSIANHRIRLVIKDVLRAYNDTPPCETDEGCEDCSLWKFFESNGTLTTTAISSSTSTSTSPTRTETCKTPGWWGCLDETTTIPPTTTWTSTITTTSCVSWGWFGCRSSVTLTEATTYPEPNPATTTDSSKDNAPAKTTDISETVSTVPSSTTCSTPGRIYGCWDKITSPAPSATHSCTTLGYVWGCRDKSTVTTGTISHEITEAPRMFGDL